MKRLVEFPTQNGQTLVIEMDDEPGPGAVRAARPGEVAERAGQTFEAALEAVRTAAEALVTRMRELSERPDEVEIEFGIKLNAQIGAIIASTDAEAHFRVTLTWTQQS